MSRLAKLKSAPVPLNNSLSRINARLIAGLNQATDVANGKGERFKAPPSALKRKISVIPHLSD